MALRVNGENFAWRLSEELLRRMIPAGSRHERAGDTPSGKTAPHPQSELIAMLRRELDIKNQQIANYTELLKGLNERLHEGFFATATRLDRRPRQHHSRGRDDETCQCHSCEERGYDAAENRQGEARISGPHFPLVLLRTVENAHIGSTTASPKRYRLPGIDREGVAPLSLLETALRTLQGGQLPDHKFETSYTYPTPAGRKTAAVRVRAPLG
ncbi:MAG TPA: hypothetical protein VHR66_20260 [Gemmataceae bacterium]|jgi:hypothetical protein|nr:hypothetical protein [Gemmataceae bacterium]